MVCWTSFISTSSRDYCSAVFFAVQIDPIPYHSHSIDVGVTAQLLKFLLLRDPGFLPHSQETTNGPYPEPDESIHSYTPTSLLTSHFLNAAMCTCNALTCTKQSPFKILLNFYHPSNIKSPVCVE
jgi:hypothetical protein